jgi:hypothetical protein
MAGTVTTSGTTPFTLSGALIISGGTAAAGVFDTASTNPTNTTRLNYEGYLYATQFWSTAYKSWGAIAINPASTYGFTIASSGTASTSAITSTGALNLTSAAASTWTHSGGAWALTSTSQNVTISTATSGTLALTSAGALTFTGASASTWGLSAATGQLLTISNNYTASSGTGSGITIQAYASTSGGTGGNITLTTTSTGTPGSIILNGYGTGNAIQLVSNTANGSITVTTSGTGKTQVSGNLGFVASTGTANTAGAFDTQTTTPTGTNRLNYSGYLYATGFYGPLTGTASGNEPSLGNPSTNGYVLSSTTGGVRSWIAPGGGATGRTAGDTGVGYLTYDGTTQAAGQLDGGSTVPTHTTRLNYDGNFYATNYYGNLGQVSGTTLTIGSTSANTTISTTTSGILAISSAGALNLKDTYLTSAIPLSQSGTSALSGFTSTSIIAALNELKSGMPLGRTAGNSSTGFVNYNGTTQSAGQFDGSTTSPSHTTQLNYDGYLYATSFYGNHNGPIGASMSIVPATNYGFSLSSTGSASTASIASTGTLNITGASTSTWQNSGGSLSILSNGSDLWLSSGAGTNASGNLYLTAGNGTGTGNITLTPTVTGTISLSGPVVIGGNLTVNGSTTIINSTTIDVDDQQMVLNYAAVGVTPSYATPAYNNSTTPAIRVRQTKNINEGDTDAWLGWDSGNYRWFVSNGNNSEALLAQSNDIVAAGNSVAANINSALLYAGNSSQGASGTFDSYFILPSATQRLNYNGNFYATNFYGLISTSVQPNITSLGTLVSLAVSGGVAAGSMGISGMITGNNGLTITNGGASIVGDLSLTGNLTVTGTITTITNLSVTNLYATNLFGPSGQLVTGDSEPLAPGGYYLPVFQPGSTATSLIVGNSGVLINPGFVSIDSTGKVSTSQTINTSGSITTTATITGGSLIINGTSVIAGILSVTGTTAGVGGSFNASTTPPSQSARLNYEGNLWATQMNATQVVLPTTSPTTVLDGAIYGGTTAPTSNQQVNVNGNLYATKIFNAVWNDIADFLEVDHNISVEYGKIYVYDENGNMRQSKERCESGIIGIASDTYGYGLGKKNINKEIPIAIGGFVLAYVDQIYPSGTALTTGPNGTLVKMTKDEKLEFPERIVATFYKVENNEEWNSIAVKGRYWVKVK